MKFRVYFNGEFDMNENGEVYTPFTETLRFDEALVLAAEHERATGYIATIERVD